MRVLAIDPVAPRRDELSQALTVLSAGGLIALPTETVYGLAVDTSNRAALLRLNRIKEKARDTPILLLLADPRQARSVSTDLPEHFGPLAARFWPGPLTLVIPAAPDLPPEITGGRETVAVRVPGLALPRRLAAELGRPISGVSANRTGRPPCRTAAEVFRAFPDGLEMILDGGAAPGSAASTILDLCRSPPRVLREGPIPLSALRPFL